MTTELSPAAKEAVAGRAAFEQAPGGIAVTTTAFEARVTVRSLDEDSWRYTVTVWLPSLAAATADEVGTAVESGWFETMARRLQDAPKATRKTVDLTTFRFGEAGLDADPPGPSPAPPADDERADLTVCYEFEWGPGPGALAVAKTFVEYVEGTYVESVVPGYDYEGAVASLLSDAASDEEGGSRGGTPL